MLHIDFLQIHAGEKVHVQVPIRLLGSPEGEKEGGVLQHVLQELEMVCVAESIPEVIEVDVSAMEIGDSIHVYDLDVPEGVEIQIEESRTVATVAVPRIIEEEEEEEEELEEQEETEEEGETEE